MSLALALAINAIAAGLLLAGLAHAMSTAAKLAPHAVRPQPHRSSRLSRGTAAGAGRGGTFGAPTTAARSA